MLIISRKTNVTDMNFDQTHITWNNIIDKLMELIQTTGSLFHFCI